MVRFTALIGALACVAAPPATADVKAGVDAWSKGDFIAAVAQWRSLAVAGDADAQFNLGQAYKLGRGVPTDPALAREWFRKAAEQGHAQAQDNYGLALFQDGRKAEALTWLEKSVARDEKRTQLVLGTMLFNGDGVPKDWTRAYALVTRSSQQGLPQASQTLVQMDQFIPEAQRQQGLILARQYETQARANAVAAPASRPGTSIATADVPPSLPRGAGSPRPGATAPVAPTPRPVAAKPPAPKPSPAASRPAASGRWRVQLGAFRDEGNARALWSRIGARVGGSPAYVAGGGVTRLQATGFASKAEAQRACAKSGTTCVVVAP